MSSVQSECPTVCGEMAPADLASTVLYCANILNIPITDSELREIVTDPMNDFVDSRVAVVLHIAKRLYHICTKKQYFLRLNAHLLMQEASRLEWRRENSFFCEAVWEQECRYLLPTPLSEANSVSDWLIPLNLWKIEGVRFPHAACLGMTLLLAALARLVMVDIRLRERLLPLLQMLVAVPAWQLEAMVCRKIQEIICRENEEC